MRVAPVPPGALSGVIGILTSEEQKDDTPFFKVLWQIILDNLKNAVQMVKTALHVAGAAYCAVGLAELNLRYVAPDNGAGAKSLVGILIFITAT